jgi:nitrite reductase (NO-forming)
MALTEGGAAYARVRAAHVTLNLLGLVGLVIVGTLPFFAATQLRVKISARAHAGAQAGLLVWQVSAVTAATVGLLAPFPTLAAVGFGAYAIGLIRLGTLLPGLRMKQLHWAGPRVLQLGAGLGWWIVVTAFAAWEGAHGRAGFTPTSLGVLVVGGFAQIFAGSLAYLGPVLRGGGHERLAAGFRVSRSWIGLVGANVAAVAVALHAQRLAVAAIALWVLDAAVRAGLLRRRAIVPSA